MKYIGPVSISVLFLSLCLSAVSSSSSSKKLGTDNANEKVVMCYWGTWAFYRGGDGKFTNTEVDPNLCTHLIYSFAGLHIASNKINTLDPELDLAPGEIEPNPNDGNIFRGQHAMLDKAVELRDGPGGNRNLKVLIAIGGWNQGSRRFSDMARSINRKTIFIESIIDFISRHNLDGIDMDWEYPGKIDAGGIPEDKENFPVFLKDLREKLDVLSASLGRSLILTSAFGVGKDTIDNGYDVPEIAKHIDYFNLMLYDFKMYSDGTPAIGHQSPLYSKPTESDGDKMLTSQWAVDYFIELGAPPEKLVLGVGTYGRTYIMADPSAHNFYDIAIGPAPAYDYTGTPGSVAYFEICLAIRGPETSNWEFRFDDDYKVPYAFSSERWIGYDDEISAQEKVDFAMERGLGGMMIWSLEQDDFKNYCGGWRKFPILGALNDRLEWHRKKNLQNN